MPLRIFGAAFFCFTTERAENTEIRKTQAFCVWGIASREIWIKFQIKFIKN